MISHSPQNESTNMRKLDGLCPLPYGLVKSHPFLKKMTLSVFLVVKMPLPDRDSLRGRFMDASLELS